MTDSDNNTSILKRLLQHKAATLSILIIITTAIVAIFAYPLSPDSSPYANRMIVEFSAKEPNFTIDLLLVPKTVRQEKGNYLSNLFNGTPDNYNAIPINKHWYANDKLYATHYIDDGMTDTISYSLTELYQTEDNKTTAEIQKAITAQQIKRTTFYLGTDRYGRDILSRLLVGARVSLAVGFIAVLLSVSIGIFLGSLSGYYGGMVDNVVMWLINILWAIPTLLLVFAITLTIGKGFWQIFIAIGLTMWVSAARLIRGQVMAIREMEYITAAKAIGVKDGRIILRHILPNIAGPVMVIAASNFATAILIEAGLSFLGIGVQPPMPSWGLMIKEHYNFLLTNRPLLAIIPGIAIMLLVYAFNILGNALRDVLDVRGY